MMEDQLPGLMRRIVAPDKTIEDFHRYIRFLEVIEENLFIRKDRLSFYAECYRAIRARIRVLYEETIRIFPGDMSAWTETILFLKRRNDIQSVAPMYAKMVTHITTPDSWICASLWSFAVGDFILSIRYLLLGLVLHPLNEALIVAYFKVCVMIAEKYSHEDEQKMKEYLTIATKWYTSLVGQLANVEVNFTLLDVVIGNEFANDLNNFIFNDIMEKYGHLEVTWRILAIREWSGPRRFISPLNIPDPISFMNEQEYNRFQSGLYVFQCATDRFQTNKMWDMLFRSLSVYCENMEITDTETIAYIMAVWKRYFEQAFNLKKLSHYGFLQYLKFLIANDCSDIAYFSLIAKNAINEYPDCSEIRQEFLEYLAKYKKFEKMIVVYKQAMIGLNYDGSLLYPLWKIILDYPDKSEPIMDEIEKNFGEFIEMPVSSSNIFKVNFLQWLFDHRGIDATRKWFEFMALKTAKCVDIFSFMSDIESQQIVPNVQEWRKCLELYSNLFGDTQAHPWMEYMWFEVHYGERTRIEGLFEAGRNKLSADLIGEVAEYYEMLQRNP